MVSVTKLVKTDTAVLVGKISTVTVTGLTSVLVILKKEVTVSARAEDL